MTPTYELDERTMGWFAERYWHEDELLADAQRRFAEVGPLIEVPSQTGALLATLVRTSGARRVLEIGTLFGFSAVWMGRALPSDGTIDTLEIVGEHADFAERVLADAGLAEQVRVHRGPALDTLAGLEGPYDLAFVDADKAGYPGYLDACLRLVRPGGVIAFDNVAMAGRVADPAVDESGVLAMRALHERLLADDRLHANVVPVGDGVAVCVVA
jgi:predicted O-methyltransferase YrrM